MKIRSYGFPKYEKKFRKIKITFRQADSILSKLQFLFNTPPVELIYFDSEQKSPVRGYYMEPMEQNKYIAKLGLHKGTPIILDVLYHEFAHHLNRMTGGISGHEEDFKYRLSQIYRSGITT